MFPFDELKFVAVTDKIFSSNLKFIDMEMENFLAEMLKMYYAGEFQNCAELATALEDRDLFNLKTENLFWRTV